MHGQPWPVLSQCPFGGILYHIPMRNQLAKAAKGVILPGTLHDALHLVFDCIDYFH